MVRRVAVPAEVLRVVGEELRGAGYRRQSRGVWVHEGESVLTGILISAHGRTDAGDVYWLTTTAAATPLAVLRAEGASLKEAFYANYAAWRVDQQDFRGPSAYEYEPASPSAAEGAIVAMLHQHLLPSAATMQEPATLFAHLRRYVFMRCEGPYQLLQFVIWALELGETADAHAAVSRYAAVQADTGGRFPPGLLDDLEDLADRYPGFQPRDAVGAGKG